MKIVKHIPNTITSLNLLCGILGVIFTFQGELSIAFYLMIAAAVCDFLDGFAARMLNAYSDMGKELDSLADLVSFGLLPSLMIHRRLIEGGVTDFWAYVPVIICIFSALRLAKFNVDDRQSENFLGLATPACAMWCGSGVYFYSIGQVASLSPVQNEWFLPVVSVILSLLLVSEIPMFSMKFKKGSKTNKVRIGFIAFIAIVAMIALIFKINWSAVVLFSMTAYILWNCLVGMISIRISVKKD
jgi:CDP-diacylglycerol--serine O-phosphatidyltransferase